MEMQPTFAGHPAPPARVDAKAIVRDRLAARQRRARRLRRTVAGVSASTFAAFWLVIYVQLASGHDPALSAHTAVAAVPITTAAAASSAPASVSSVSTASSGSSVASTPAASVTPTPMTTRQS